MTTLRAGKRSDAQWVKLARQGDPEALKWAFDCTAEHRKKAALHWFSNACWADVADAEQVGVLGVVQAIKFYDLNSSCSFKSYAWFQIRRAVSEYFNRTVFCVRLPNWLHERRVNALKKSPSASMEQALKGFGVSPDIAQIAAHISSTVSLEVLHETSHQEQSIPDEVLSTETPESAQVKSEERELLHELLSTLDVQEAQLIRRLWRIEDTEEKPEEIFAGLKLTVAEGVELQRRAMVKLRKCPLLKKFGRRLQFSNEKSWRGCIVHPSCTPSARSTTSSARPNRNLSVPLYSSTPSNAIPEESL